MADTICPAQDHHRQWLVANDRWVDERWILRCIELGEYLIAERGGQPSGFLRWSWFWGKIPYIDMIHVDPSQRRTGIGSLLLSDFERCASSYGTRIVMTSCESDEHEPLSWHLKNGFRRTGEITIPTIQSSSEIFLVKLL
jgi:GNAT superfamily N-acetyltransferase